MIIALTTAPEMIEKKSKTFKECDSNQTFNCINNQSEQEFYLMIEDVEKKNNFLHLEVLPKLKENVKEIDVNYTLIVKHGNDKVKSLKNENDKFKDEDGYVPISCYISYAKEPNYSLRLKFYSSLEKVKTLKFEISFVRTKFFNFVLIVKYFFFVFNICGIVLFFYMTREIKFRYMHFETINSLLMNFSLLIFNEPLIGIYTMGSVFGLTSTGISVFCNVQFMCAVIMFWLFMLQKLNDPYCKNVIKLVEFVFICSLFSFLFVIYVYVESNLKFDPNYDWENDLKSVRKKIYIVLISVLVLFAVWMIALIAMSLRKWNDDKFCIRQKIYWGINYAIIIITFIFIGFGYIQIMQIGSILLSVIALYNIYFSILLFVSIPDLDGYKSWIDEAAKERPNSMSN